MRIEYLRGLLVDLAANEEGVHAEEVGPDETISPPTTMPIKWSIFGFRKQGAVIEAAATSSR